MHRVNAQSGVEPLLIDAKHVSPASRHRLWRVTQTGCNRMVMFSLQPLGATFHALRAIARRIDRRFNQQAST
eukprot:10733317-Karenia_brevis.AAC.1